MDNKIKIIIEIPEKEYGKICSFVRSVKNSGFEMLSIPIVDEAIEKGVIIKTEDLCHTCQTRIKNIPLLERT